MKQKRPQDGDPTRWRGGRLAVGDAVAENDAEGAMAAVVGDSATPPRMQAMMHKGEGHQGAAKTAAQNQSVSE